MSTRDIHTQIKNLYEVDISAEMGKKSDASKAQRFCVSKLLKIRSSTRYVSYKDLKAFTTDLKTIYKASSEEEGLENLIKVKEKP